MILKNSGAKKYPIVKGHAIAQMILYLEPLVEIFGVLPDGTLCKGPLPVSARRGNAEIFSDSFKKVSKFEIAVRKLTKFL